MSPPPRVALVTGAGSGIGKAAALALLREGHRVALAGRRRERLEETAAESTAGERALVAPADVSDPASVKDLFAATVAVLKSATPVLSGMSVVNVASPVAVVPLSAG